MSSNEARVEELLDYLKRTRGFEFSAYKRSSLMRRIQKRLQAVNRAAIRTHAVTYGAVNGGLVAIWGATGGGAFWPGWSMAWWGAALGWHWLASRAVGSALGGGRRAREMRARRDSRLLSR